MLTWLLTPRTETRMRRYHKHNDDCILTCTLCLVSSSVTTVTPIRVRELCNSQITLQQEHAPGKKLKLPPQPMMWSKNLIRATTKLSHVSAARMLSTVPYEHDIKIVEVGPRDGLQNEKALVSTENKIQLIQKLADAGCTYIETGAFVSKKWVPNMADSDKVMEGLKEWKSKRTGLVFSCLTPNIKGLDLAIQAQSDEIAIFGSASEEFSQRNINCSIEESLARFAQVAEKANELNIPMRGYVSCVMGCPYQGEVKSSEVARVTEKLFELGCHEVSLGDTIGIGTPGKAIDMLEAVATVAPVERLAGHFHDTYGMALANIVTALGHGIRVFDSSVAGLGGCPYARGASGNVATEEVVYMMNGLGLETGIDLDKLIEAGGFISGVIGRETQSKVARAVLAKQQSYDNS